VSEGRGQYSRTELPHGLTVLTESMSGVRSASVGVWVRFGSAHEQREEMGIAHLLEHMVFKATAQRSARDIALSLERLGGSLDAYTTREHTSFQARVLDEHLDVALDVLADLVVHPTLRAEDLELEREVILEEISTVEDTPDDLIFELQSKALWNGHPYGHSILGTRETIAQLTATDLQRVHRSAYSRPNIVIAAAGHVAHEPFVRRVESLFAGAPTNGTTPLVAVVDTEPVAHIRQTRDTAQTHVTLAARTFGHPDPRRYAFVLLSNAMGGGMSSRLFQRVREELGLAYSVYSFQSFYRNAGLSGVYVGTRPEWGDRALEVIRAEMMRVARSGLDAQELQDAKGQLKGQLALSLESSGGRMHRLAAFELYEESFQNLDELTARIDAVTQDDVAAVAAEYWDPDRHTLVRLGPEAA
jgi:predicted Zn-dependent peptidase